MRDAFVDVFLEVPVRELAALHDPTAALYERMREGADAKCAEVGARLRTDRAPEVRVVEAQTPLGVDVTLVGSRWAVVAPEGVL